MVDNYDFLAMHGDAMAILAPPEMRGEQDQHREYFQAADQHRKGAHPGLEIGQPGVIIGWTDQVKSRAKIIDASQNR
jgi:hypothetical protein